MFTPFAFVKQEAAGNTFIVATGGTITNSGSYTIHTFTGDGTFATNATYAIN